MAILMIIKFIRNQISKERQLLHNSLIRSQPLKKSIISTALYFLGIMCQVSYRIVIKCLGAEVFL